jgi:hypothetical protein
MTALGSTARIGFDVGRVIVDFLAGRSAAIAEHDFLDVPPAPLAFQVIGDCVRQHGAGKIFIISRCGDTVRDMTRRWLVHQDFYAATGFLVENLHFTYRCEEKAEVARNLPGGPLSHFVDDGMAVLSSMHDVTHRLLFGPQPAAFVPPAGITMVPSWEALRPRLNLV